jgi:hypothetical protein
MIRKPAAAGRFYPGNPNILTATVQSLLDAVPTGESPHPVGYVVPHAGCPYSGPTASYAFKRLAGKTYDRVIIIGPSHFDPFEGITTWIGTGLETPLGIVETALEDRDRLVDQFGVQASELGFGQEHAIEVELPFLQLTLTPGWKLVPLIMGRQSERTVEIAARILRTYQNGNHLILISSDLSHFHPYDRANQIDGELLRLVEMGDIEALLRAHREKRIEACGFGPLVAFLKALSPQNDCAIDVLDYRNSGDTGGHLDRVVGYAAIEFTRQA